MTTEPLQAWLIHKTPIGDTSLRLRCFTREKGLLDCHYRGGRAAKKNMALQPFTPLWLLLNERHHWFYVKSLETAGLPLALHGQPLFAALYINELVFHTLTPQEQNEPLFISYQDALTHLATTKHPAAIEVGLRIFEKRILSACGYSLTLTTESNTPNPINPHDFYQFIPGYGFKKTTRGIPGEHLLAFAEEQFENPEVLKIAKFIMRQAINHLLGGRQLQSRTLYTAQTTVPYVTE